MLDKVKNYYESELKSAKLTCNCKLFSKKEVISNAVMRCLGVAIFVQTADETILYDDIDKLYEEYRTKLEELENV